ncbi:MAG: GlmU family protein [Bacteroidales bacterium]|nr:GlmU family protein [Bacteroidales bacterium]MBQ9311930.1 GlmU family protein [Bacteroidales bacterium]
MNYILFDDATREALKPLTYTRPLCEIRVGILTIREKWEKYLQQQTSTLTDDYLSKKYPMEMSEAMMLINGSVCPTKEMTEAIKKMTPGQTLINGEVVLAMYKTKEGFLSDEEESSERLEFCGEYTKLNALADIFLLNDKEIRCDFDLLCKGRKSQKLSSTNTVIGDDIFVEEGAVVECATLNTKEGPIYIGKDAEIMEQSTIRGPFALCEGAMVRMSAKIYGATTIGPHCKVGGELSNVVMFGYSNKTHDGFFGNSVIGEWCNIGADSNASNLKNTYEEVRLWNIEKNTFVPTGTIFCGTIMGDHSKCGINTMFNTGTVVGVNCNIFGHGYQRNYIPSFTWGGNNSVKVYDIEKAIEVAQIVEQRRHIEMSDNDKEILRYLYKTTLRNRK